MDEYVGRELWVRWVTVNATAAAAGAIAGTILAIPFFFLCGYASILVGPFVGWVVLTVVVSGAQQVWFWPFASLSWTQVSILGGLLAIPIGSAGGVAFGALGWG